MYKHKPGFAGHDSMREKAERMFRKHLGHDSHHEEGYKKGGHVKHKMSGDKINKNHHSKHHGLSREQTDLHLPRHVSHRAKMEEGGCAMKRGGHAHHKKHHVKHKADGGMLSESKPFATSAMKRGGRAHHKKHMAMGGDVYEHQMVGMHPTHTMHHYDYESEMRGTPKSLQHSAMKRGGHAHSKKHMAMGGIGKIRHEQSDKKGHPIHKKRNLVRHMP